MTARSHDESGATAVEYGVMVALIAAIIVASIVTLGGHTRDAIGSPCAELSKVGHTC